jgi:ATP-dependent DNA helicase DinG
VVALSAAPIEVGAQLAALLDRASVTLTSATLAVGESFAYTLERNGLAGDERVETHRYGTPFDLAANRRVIVARGVPEPASREFPDAAVEVVRAVSRLGRRMLVLATSRHQAAALSRRLSRIPGLPLHTQTDGGARGDLLERFKATGGVLVGLASFWEGVDLPGELLEVVCVLKLPFLVPSAPVVAARSQRLAAVGEDPFETMFVPDVVLRLRQGIGRLIRTGSDRGAVILLDRRLVTAPYGATVLGAIADDVVRCDSAEGIAAAVAGVFDGSR